MGRCRQMVTVGLASPFLCMECYVWLTPLQQDRECLISDLKAEAVACLAGLQTVFTLENCSACQGIRVLTDSKSLVQRLSQGPARQSDPMFCSIWTVLSAIGSSNAVNVQWHRHTWACKAIQQLTKKRSEGACFYSQPFLWTTFQPPKLLNDINEALLRIGTLAILMPGFIEYLQADNTVTSIGNGVGPGTSASWWHKYALAILRWQQLTYTISGAGTRPILSRRQRNS